jgi:hypothetical protein
LRELVDQLGIQRDQGDVVPETDLDVRDEPAVVEQLAAVHMGTDVDLVGLERGAAAQAPGGLGLGGAGAGDQHRPAGRTGSSS